ncbi:MAG: OmpA family protein [Flavobacteriaceae bacterium]
MKKAISTCILLLSMGLYAQVPQDGDVNNDDNITDVTTDNILGPNQTIDVNQSFDEAARKYNVAYQTSNDVKGVDPGYYIIAESHFSEGKAKKAANKMKKGGLKTGYIFEPNDEIFHVHVAMYPYGLEAVEACVTQLDGKIDNSLWILEVPPNKDVSQNEVVDNGETKSTDNGTDLEEVTYDMLEDLKEDTPQPKSAKAKGPNRSKLVQRADDYFDKMWYAEAADLYEQALSRGEKNYSYDIIQRAGDSHYFNTNMEQAYHWYNILYEKYGDEMSNDNLFKYAHTLKGTGKYSRAKRLIKLYNKNLNKEGVAISTVSSDMKPAEVVLDEILNSEKKFDIKNLDINTEYSDFGVTYIDTSQVVFASARDSAYLNTRRYKWNNQPYLDLYAAKLNEESDQLKEASKFSKNVNTKYHEATVTFSPDNKTMYFTRNNYGRKLRRDDKGINHLKIYVSSKEGDEWGEAVELPFNSDNYSTGHPALSPDGKKLYFVSDMPGSIGDTDIFVVDVLGNNSFSEPKNLGPAINTEKKEMFPFITEDKLYFSSNGHVGLGGQDIFKASYSEEEGFDEPVNIGVPINSNKDDFAYVIDEDKEIGFFSSNREGGKGDDDIYSFKKLLVEEVVPGAIAGVVTDKITGEPMPQALVQLLDENGIKLKEVVANEDGSFIFEDLEGDKKYTVQVSKDGYHDEFVDVTTVANDTVNITVPMRTLDENLNNLKDKILVEEGIKKLKTDMIHFDFDKSYIRPDAAEELDKLVATMLEFPSLVIKIESHTDSRGTREYNRGLSNRRAQATRDYIISKGIAPSRIESATGYGEERLLNGCDGSVRCTEEEHYFNRRSEFIIVNM